jgi:hypothetical protein
LAPDFSDVVYEQLMENTYYVEPIYILLTMEDVDSSMKDVSD